MIVHFEAKPPLVHWESAFVGSEISSCRDRH
jgi:hypothetical protein